MELSERADEPDQVGIGRNTQPAARRGATARGVCAWIDAVRVDDDAVRLDTSHDERSRRGVRDDDDPGRASQCDVLTGVAATRQHVAVGIEEVGGTVVLEEERESRELRE